MIKYIHKVNFSSKTLRPDVAIVGAGPAGSALACALATSEHFNPNEHKKIVVIDPSKLPNIDTYMQADRMPEPRVVTLSPASLRLFKSVGALQKCNHRYITPFTDMLVYEQAGSAYMRFNNKMHQESVLVQAQNQLMRNFLMSAYARDKYEESDQYLGASIENQHITAALLARLEESGKCEVIQQKVSAIKPAKNASELPLITLEDGTAIEPQLMVGSDGEKSLTRTEYGIGTWGQSYHAKGLVCTVRTLQPHTIAFQRFLKTGPLAILPLWEDYSSIVWSLPSDLCQKMQDMDEQLFMDKLNEAMMNVSDAPILGALPDRILPYQIKRQNFERPPLVKALGTRRFAFPLNLSHSNSLAANRMALIGDAAHRVHPLAGQGLNLGIADVAFLANTIVKAKNEGQDIGNFDFVLSHYDKQARANAMGMIAAIEFVKNAYSPNFAGSETLGHLLALGRNVALDIIESSDLMKHNFMQFASGSVTHPSKYEWQA